MSRARRLDGFVRSARDRVAAGVYACQGEPLQPHGRLSKAIERPDAVIAELKPRSPSRGALLEGPPGPVLEQYAAGGACAISVLTDGDHFGGGLELLRQAHTTGLPTMMKDFVVDPAQIDAAAHCGASAVLLIERVLEPAEREALVDAAHAAGIEVLLEVFDAADWSAARGSAADLIGVNARDLETLRLDAARQQDLVAAVAAAGRPAVALSGIRRRRDRRAVRAAGARAVLVGTSLMRHPDRRLALTAMRHPLAKVCGLTHPDDVDAAAAAGADLAGFVVGTPRSPRDLAPDDARRLMAYARMHGMVPVLVTAMDDADAIALWAAACRPAYVQAPAVGGLADRLHAAGALYLVATTPDEKMAGEGADAAPGGADGTGGADGHARAADGWVIDTPSATGGGSGRTHDWARTAAVCDGAPNALTLVAGGLAADNAAKALAASHAWGADASSRLESSPGRKDAEAVRAFVAAVHGADA